MKTKIIFSVLVLLAIAFTLAPNPCLSAVPSLINYQGVLKDSTGVPYHGPATMIFSIWDDPTDGNKLWQETHPVVEVSHGLFNALLGNVNNPIPDSVFDQPNAWLDVLANGSQLSPRRRMVSVGYAFRSEFADTAEYARSAPRDDDWTPDTAGFNIYRLTGNVGIGTPTPQNELDVEGGVAVGPDYSGMHAAPENGMIIEGNVGIGTTNPSEKLEVNGHIKLVGDANESPAVMFSTNTASKFYVKYQSGGLSIAESGVGSRLIVKDGGNVGIATTDPQYTLDVEGNVEAHAYYTGDIIFQKDKEKLWRMFEDEEGLYLENLKTGTVYRFVLQEVEKE